MRTVSMIGVGILLLVVAAPLGCGGDRNDAPARAAIEEPHDGVPAAIDGEHPDDLVTVPTGAAAETPEPDAVSSQPGGGMPHPPGGPGLSDQAVAAARSIDPVEKSRVAREVARVNGEPLTVLDMERRLTALHTDLEAVSRGDFDLDRLLFRMVNDLLLAQEARALGMDAEEPTVSQVKKHHRDQALAALEREEILARAQVSEEEIRRAFAEQYRRTDLTVITVDTEEAAAGILAEIRAGADMSALAKERSHDPYAPRGGRAIGLPVRDLASEIGELAGALEPGQTGGPVLTDLGWSVIRLDGYQDADPDAYAGARSIIRELITMEKIRVRKAELAARAESNHSVLLEQDLIQAIQPTRLPDGRLGPEVDDRSVVVARIGDAMTISAGEYADALMVRWSGVRNEEAAAAAAPIILRRLIDRALLLAEADRLGYRDRPEVERSVRDYETRILAQRYLEEILGSQVEVTVDEMRAHYEENRDRFPRPPRLHLGQITVETEEEATEVIDLLRRGTDLAWLARQRSVDRFSTSGGVRGWTVPSPGADALNDGLLRASVGDVLGPFGVPGNFIVIKVDSREEQGLYTFEEVSGNIRNAVFSTRFRKVLDEFLTKLRSRARIEVQEEVLASLRVGGTSDEKIGQPADGGQTR